MKDRGTRRSRRWLIGAFVGLALVLAGCAENAPQDTLQPEGKFARQIDNLWQWPYWISVVVFFVVEGLIVYALFRYRRRGGEERPKQIHGNFKLEVSLTALPLVILLGLAVPTVGTLLDLAEKPAGKNYLKVEVIGHQWWWEYRYPNGVHTANELVIPTGEDILLTMRSEDVIHSFWVPKLNGKRDVIPGRVQQLKIQADHPGTYYGQCTEFCGDSHAYMKNRAVAMSRADFDQWLADQKKPAATPAAGSDAETGLGLFTAKGCAGCHTVKGVSQGLVGPDLTHLQSRGTFAGSWFKMNETNLAAWLRNPPGEKPGAKMPNLKLTEDEIRQLVAYLETLK